MNHFPLLLEPCRSITPRFCKSAISRLTVMMETCIFSFSSACVINRFSWIRFRTWISFSNRYHWYQFWFHRYETLLFQKAAETYSPGNPVKINKIRFRQSILAALMENPGSPIFQCSSCKQRRRQGHGFTAWNSLSSISADLIQIIKRILFLAETHKKTEETTSVPVPSYSMSLFIIS